MTCISSLNKYDTIIPRHHTAKLSNNFSFISSIHIQVSPKRPGLAISMWRNDKTCNMFDVTSEKNDKKRHWLMLISKISCTWPIHYAKFIFCNGSYYQRSCSFPHLISLSLVGIGLVVSHRLATRKGLGSPPGLCKGCYSPWLLTIPH